MTTPFVAQLRSRAEPVQLAAAGADAITVRVEVPEIWDTVKVVVSPTQTAAELKSAALDVLYPAREADDFVLKLRGWEVLNERASLTDLGARDGSIFLLTLRRRRAVR